MVVRWMVGVGIAAMSISCNATQCRSNGPPNEVELHLNWCAQDRGRNEGANCGATVLRGTSIPNLVPSGLDSQSAAAYWDRSKMMAAATIVARTNRRAAVDVAICCQIHSKEAYSCLAKNRPAIEAWFTSKAVKGAK